MPVTDTPLAAVLMAGGLGTRMRSAVPKHLHPILGRRMVDWIVEAGRAAGAAPIVIVASPAFAPQVAKILAPLPYLTVAQVAAALEAGAA